MTKLRSGNTPHPKNHVFKKTQNNMLAIINIIFCLCFTHNCNSLSHVDKIITCLMQVHFTSSHTFICVCGMVKLRACEYRACVSFLQRPVKLIRWVLLPGA